MAGLASLRSGSNPALSGEWVCPQCRAVDHAPDAPGLPVPRCAACLHAMVPADALASSDGDPFLGRLVAGRFVVLRRLGAGSMGTVYRARQEAVARDIALKILRSDRALDALARQRFVREAKAMSLLASPHTVTVFDFGEMADPPGDADLGDGGVSLFLAMELLDGESLGDRLKRVGRLPWTDAVSVVRQALLSLAEAHEKGVIHRDLKPDNLFHAKAANGGEIVKVLDFGIAKVLTDKTPMVDQLETQAGTVFGTPRYMSPEQAQGRPLDARSDLYSLGVILYQMLVGRAPFVDDDAVVVMARHIKQKPVPPHEAAKDAAIPPAVSQLVMRILAKDPDARPEAALAFIEELDQVSRAATPIVPDPTASGNVIAVTHLGAPDGLTEEAPPASVSPRGADAVATALPSTRTPAPAASSRTRTALVVLGAAVLVAAGATLLSGVGTSSPPARSAVGPAARARADVLLASLSARAAASGAPAAAPSSSASASSAPAIPSAPAAQRPPSAASPAGAATPSAAPSAKTGGKKPKYTRFE